MLRRRFLAATLFCAACRLFFSHVTLLGKCMPHEHPHDRRSAFLDSGSNVWAERIHCCIKGVCTAAVVAFLRLRRVFVSGGRPFGGFSAFVRWSFSQRQPWCVFGTQGAAHVQTIIYVRLGACRLMRWCFLAATLFLRGVQAFFAHMANAR